MWLEGMTLKVSGDAEVLGFLESGNSLTPGSGSRKAVSAVIFEPPKIKSATVFTVSPYICHEVMGPDAMILVF